jgi:serine/threonine-protein phosphatase PPG1
MWSDPDDNRPDFAMSPRGAGYTYGRTAVDAFLHLNEMHHILRAHQLCMEGYQVLFDDRLSTVWSAPNYCYRCGNLASILEVSMGGQQRYFNVFDAAPEDAREAQVNGDVVDDFASSTRQKLYASDDDDGKWLIGPPPKTLASGEPVVSPKTDLYFL